MKGWYGHKLKKLKNKLIALVCNYFISILIILLFIIAWYSPYSIPNFMEITDCSSANTTLSIIAGALARHLIENINKTKMNEESLIYICRVFNKLREIIEQSNTPETAKLYMEMREQVVALEKWMKFKGKSSEMVLKEIRNTLDQFDKLHKYLKTIQSHLIEWPTTK